MQVFPIDSNCWCVDLPLANWWSSYSCKLPHVNWTSSNSFVCLFVWKSSIEIWSHVTFMFLSFFFFYFVKETHVGLVRIDCSMLQNSKPSFLLLSIHLFSLFIITETPLSLSSLSSSLSSSSYLLSILVRTNDKKNK